MIRSVLLDLDGTLIDSTIPHTDAWVEALAERGKHPEREEVRRAIGRGADTLLPLFLSEAEIAEYGEALSKRRTQIFMERHLAGVGPIPGAREFVLSLLERNLKVALGSSAAENELDALATAGGLADLPIAATNAGDAERSKPAPDIWLAAMKSIEADPATTAIVGDTPYDVEAAKAAGLRAVGVMTGGWTRDELEQAGYDEVYLSVAELNIHLDQSLIGMGDPL